MMTPEVAPEIVRFYSESIDEADRLSTTADGHLELVRPQELLRRHLPPPPARILDVGGGPGVHARWLVADGYDVHVVDPIPRHLPRPNGSAQQPSWATPVTSRPKTPHTT